MSALDPAFLGLGRPSSLTSDSPFAIADAARRDTTTPSAPKTVQPKPRQPQPQLPAQQHHYQSPPQQHQQQGYPQQAPQQYRPQPAQQYPPQGGYTPSPHQLHAQPQAAYQRPGVHSMPSSGSVQSGVSYASSSSGRAPPPAQQPPHHPPQQQPPNPSHPQQPGQQGYPRPQQQAAPQGYMAPPPNPPRGGHSPAPGPTPFHAHAPQHPGAPPRYPSSAPSAVSYQSPTPGPGYAPPPQGHAHGPGQAGASSAHAYAQQYGAGASSGPGGQGYAPAQPGSRTSRDRPGQPAPANPEEELRQLFADTNISRSGQLSAKEVQALLSQEARSGGGGGGGGGRGRGAMGGIEAREDCVKMLMNIFDTDRSGTINFSEFEGLYRYIKDWHAIFNRFDRDGSGTIDRHELEQALQSFGFPLPPDLVRKLEKRFAPPKGDPNAPRGIAFDRFLMACVTVKHFSESFRKRDVRSEGRLTLDYNSFMELVIEAPS